MTPEGSSGFSAPAPAPTPAAAAAPARPPFALIVSITVTGIMANTLVTPATPDIVADFGAGPSAIGLLLAASTAPGVLLAPVIGVLADRFGRREVLVPCLALFGVAGGCAAFAPSLATLAGLRVLQGVGAAGLINLAIVLIGDHWEGVERVRAIGRNSAALTASIAVLPPLGGALTAVGGWRLAFVPFWIGLVTAVVVWRTLPRAARHEGSVGDQLRAALPHLRTPTVLGTTALAFVVFAVIFGFFLTVLPVHLQAAFGLGPAQRGLMLALPSITSTSTALSLGRVRRRVPPGPLMGVGCLLLAGGLVVLALAPSVAVAAVAALIYGFGEGVLIPTMQDSVAGSAPATSRASVVATFTAVCRLGQTVGPLGLGAALEVAAARYLFGLGAIVSAALAAVPVLFVRDPAPAGEIAAASAKSVP